MIRIHTYSYKLCKVSVSDSDLDPDPQSAKISCNSIFFILKYCLKQRFGKIIICSYLDVDIRYEMPYFFRFRIRHFADPDPDYPESRLDGQKKINPEHIARYKDITIKKRHIVVVTDLFLNLSVNVVNDKTASSSSINRLTGRYIDRNNRLQDR